MTSCQPSLTSNTALMLISNKDHLSTDFEDLSNYNHTITATATTPVYHDSLPTPLQETDTAIAMNLEGSHHGGYITVGNASHSAWNWGSGEWTIEFSYKPKSSNYALLSKWNTSNNQWTNEWFFGGGTNAVTLYLIGPNGDSCPTYPNTGNCYYLWGFRASKGENWTHVAAQRVNNGNKSAIELYVDGCLQHRVKVASYWHIHQPANNNIQNLIVGQFYGGVGNTPPGFQGHFDNIRIEKGKALYGSEFACGVPCFTTRPSLCSINSYTCSPRAEQREVIDMYAHLSCCNKHELWLAGRQYGTIDEPVLTTNLAWNFKEKVYNGGGAIIAENSSIAAHCWRLVTPHYSTLQNHPEGPDGIKYWKPYHGFGNSSHCCKCIPAIVSSSCEADYRAYIQTDVTFQRPWTGQVRDFSDKVAEKDGCPGCSGSESSRVSPTKKALSAPKVIVRPGYHCYAQSFEVMEFFSAPQSDGGCFPNLCPPYDPQYNCYRLTKQLPYTNTDPMSTYWYTPFARPVRYFTEGASSGKGIWTNYWTSHNCKPSISSSCSGCCELTNETAVGPEELSNKPVDTIACGVEWVRPEYSIQISTDDCDATLTCGQGFTKFVFYNNLSFAGPWFHKSVPSNYYDFRPPWCNPSHTMCCSCEPTTQASLNPWLIEIIRCANGESLGYATVGANSPLLGAGYIVNNGADNLCARGVKIMRVHNGASSATLNAGHTLMGQPTTNCQDCIGNYGI